MTHIRIIFGTESGSSELAADDIAEALAEQHEVSVENMSEVNVGEFATDALYLVICSSYGEGELPYSARPFHEALTADRPDLRGVRYGVLGRGDTSYLKTYLAGSKTIDSLLADLGAERIGEFGEHDASDWSADEDLPIHWARGIVDVYEKAVISL